jgi:hypothetical protein
MNIIIYAFAVLTAVPAIVDTQYQKLSLQLQHEVLGTGILSHCL